MSMDSTFNVPATTKDGKVSHVNSLEYIGLLYNSFHGFLGKHIVGEHFVVLLFDLIVRSLLL